MQHAVALVGCFLTHRQAVYKWKLSDNCKYNPKLLLLMLHFRPNRTLRGVYCFPINQSQKLNQQILPVAVEIAAAVVMQINVGNYEGKSWVLMCLKYS